MKRDHIAAALHPLAERMHRGYCWKKTPDGPRRIDQRFTAVELNEHAHGVVAYGLCPISPGTSTCRVACLDLDSHKGEVPWAAMQSYAAEISLSLEIEGMVPHLFRSSGGKGIHIYLVWAEPQDAYSVRELLRNALAACNLKSGTKGVAHSEVEIFPKQNEVKGDGYGSMFILPWDGESNPLGEFTGWHDSPAVPLRTREERSASSAATRALPAIARLKSALDAIPNRLQEELSYDEWRNIVFALHAATGGNEIGLDLAHEFSARSGKYDADFLTNRVWPYIHATRDGPSITEGTLFAAATAHGWEDRAALDDFDVVASGESSAQPAPLAAARFRFLPQAEFTAGSPPEYIVQDVIPDADLVVVFGESASGKSFWTLDIVKAIANGTPWRDKRVKQGRVGYVAAEGAGGFRNRLKAYAQEFQSDEIKNFFVLPDAPSFLEVAHVKDVIRRLQEIGGVKVVVVDTLAQVSPGGAENSSEDMGKVIMHCRQIRKHTGATVILIHHSGKDSTKGARGWSGLRGATDAEVEIIRVEHDRVAVVTKQKDGEDGSEFGFKLRQIVIGRNDHGESITSCVVEHGAAKEGVRQRAAVRLAESERAAWLVVESEIEMFGATERMHIADRLVPGIAAADTSARSPKEKTQQAKRGITGLISKGMLDSDGTNVWKGANA